MKARINQRNILGLAAFGMLFLIQGYWLFDDLDGSESAFDHSVSVALYAAADSIAENVVVEKKSENYFFVTAKTSVSTEDIDTLVREEFSKRAIDQSYEIGVYNAKDDSLIHGKYINKPSLVPRTDLTLETDQVQKNFAVLFPAGSSMFSSTERMETGALMVISFALIALFMFVGFKPKQASDPLSLEIKVGDSVFDTRNQTLLVNGDSFQLTHKESQLVKLFFENPNTVIARDEFLEKVWKQDGFFVARSMDVFISKIRKYLKGDPALKIENLRSIGYRLTTKN